jgi:hypothetical protein
MPAVTVIEDGIAASEFAAWTRGSSVRLACFRRFDLVVDLADLPAPSMRSTRSSSAASATTMGRLDDVSCRRDDGPPSDGPDVLAVDGVGLRVGRGDSTPSSASTGLSPPRSGCCSG